MTKDQKTVSFSNVKISLKAIPTEATASCTLGISCFNVATISLWEGQRLTASIASDSNLEQQSCNTKIKSALTVKH